MTKPISDNEIVSARTFSASRERVFKAFSDPEQLAQWWGPQGFTNTFHQFDLRPGGRWRFVMHGPDGTDYPLENEFIEVAESERVVFDHLEAVHSFRMTLSFTEQGGETAVEWRMRFVSAAEFLRTKDSIIPANEQNFDRLAAHLKRTTP